MKTPFTSRRFDLFVLVVTVFGLGGLTGSLTAKPQVEVVTVSEDVPSSCRDAANSGFAALKAWEAVDQYEMKAEVLASNLTLVTLAGDAALIEDALSPIADHNDREAKKRAERDEARGEFELSADECLSKAVAAGAAGDR